MGNVATLLVRWPHAPLQSAPRSWREVLENDRFQYLFPRRPQPFAQHTAQTFEAGANAAEAAVEEEHGSGSDQAAAAGPGLADVQQAALMEVVERLQAVQQHLQDADDGSSNTIITVAAFTADDFGDDSDGVDEGASCSSHSDVEADDRRGTHATAAPLTLQHSNSDRGQGAGRTEERKAHGSGAGRRWDGVGRRMRSPCARRQRGRRPAPPWDDSQPFQTHVGTVFHFWQLCPYG